MLAACAGAPPARRRGDALARGPCGQRSGAGRARAADADARGMRGTAALASVDPRVSSDRLGADADAHADDRAVRPGAARGARRTGTQRGPRGRVGRGATHPRVGRPLPGREGARRARSRVAAHAGGDACGRWRRWSRGCCSTRIVAWCGTARRSSGRRRTGTRRRSASIEQLAAEGVGVRRDRAAAVRRGVGRGTGERRGVLAMPGSCGRCCGNSTEVPSTTDVGAEMGRTRMRGRVLSAARQVLQWQFKSGRGQSGGVPVSSALIFHSRSRVVAFRDWREVRMGRPRRSKQWAVTVSSSGADAA